ncbi:permease [Belliella kenyensis]|uniref:Permease n=1 Tax=Belliella kenyensis TaxID=1472724 RepID=A0ABV8EQ20_9BACT|nr:permease [Belliella kenyensis]MCH7403357.1 permease [Belliella kenyensis]MDN3601569.1 permease [Belliella kenyensis]
MSIALQKTLSLILLIVLGLILKRKFTQPEQQKGLKMIILDIALPAMIFVALLKIEINPDLLILPILALLFNILFLVISKYALPVLGIEQGTASMRTLLLLLPSLAPGLTCFPFVVSYLGEDVLAWAALADIGNKFFVLVLAYLLAISWYYKHHQLKKASTKDRVKQLLLAMLKEPINLVMISAIILLSFGINMEALPVFISEAILMMKDMMTPLVLLFIGIAVVFKWDQLRMLAGMLLFRAGVTFTISGIFVAMVPMPIEAILLAVVFPQSAVSFWPFAHMSAIRSMELGDESKKTKPTFDLELGVNLLALSMPFSTLLILGIFSSGTYFTNPYHIFLFGGIMLILSFLPKISKWISTLAMEEELGSLSEQKLNKNNSIE